MCTAYKVSLLLFKRLFECRRIDTCNGVLFDLQSNKQPNKKKSVFMMPILTLIV